MSSNKNDQSSELSVGDIILSHILDHPLGGHSEESGTKTKAHEVQADDGFLAQLNYQPSVHGLMVGITAVLMLVIFLTMARKKATGRGRFFSMLEAFILFIRDEIAIPNIGEKDGRRFTPFLLTVFFFILIANYLGLVPGSYTATSNISVTVALATLAFLVIQYGGIKENGVWGYFKSLIPHGLPVMLLPMIIVIEIAGLFTKPFALCVRLFANMVAGHVVILSLICLVFILETVLVGVFMTIPMALFVYSLELLVCFLQAYIFTMLTAIFIGMSVHPEH